MLFPYKSNNNAALKTEPQNLSKKAAPHTDSLTMVHRRGAASQSLKTLSFKVAMETAGQRGSNLTATSVCVSGSGAITRYL